MMQHDPPDALAYHGVPGGRSPIAGQPRNSRRLSNHRAWRDLLPTGRPEAATSLPRWTALPAYPKRGPAAPCSTLLLSRPPFPSLHYS